MKKLNCEDHKLSIMTNEEMQELNGGFISFISFRSIADLVVGEVSDMIDGFKAGYNAATSFTIESK